MWLFCSLCEMKKKSLKTSKEKKNGLNLINYTRKKFPFQNKQKNKQWRRVLFCWHWTTAVSYQGAISPSCVTKRNRAAYLRRHKSPVLYNTVCQPKIVLESKHLLSAPPVPQTRLMKKWSYDVTWGCRACLCWPFFSSSSSSARWMWTCYLSPEICVCVCPTWVNWVWLRLIVSHTGCLCVQWKAGATE